METPTITKKQAKKTLAGKKAKRETIKNVLAKPYDQYWPLLSPEDNTHLTGTLERLLPRLANNKISVPYKIIREVPRDKRQEFREKFGNQSPPLIDRAAKSSLIFGVNAVARLIEMRKAGSVLVASDVKPRLLVQHVLDLAVLYSVPVLIVGGLRDVLKKKCGRSGAVVALKRSVNPDSALGLIQQTIFYIYEKYPVPETHINYERRLEHSAPIEIPDSDDKTGSSVICIDSDEDSDDLKKKNYHLQRGSNRLRVFIPETKEGSEEKAMTICFDSPDPSPPTNNNKQAKYRPLVVKRVRGDKDRSTKKIQKLKK